MVKLSMKKKIFYNDRLVKKDLNVSELLQSQKINKISNVDINKLLNRVKLDHKIEKKKKIIFLSLVILLLGLMGIFVSIVR
jgi:hypothetical protein